jgi:hypothetical protein
MRAIASDSKGFRCQVCGAILLGLLGGLELDKKTALRERLSETTLRERLNELSECALSLICASLRLGVQARRGAAPKMQEDLHPQWP